MAKRKNSLPSGNFRVLALDYTDPNGKRHYKSFTAPTKKEARMLADEWKLSKKRNRAENISVRVAVQRYKDMKAAVLSPSTLRGYAGLLRTHFQGDFGSTRLNELNSQIVQIWISDLSKRLSPKTVRNAYALRQRLSICLPPTFLSAYSPPGSTRSYIVRTTQTSSGSWLNLRELIWKQPFFWRHLVRFAAAKSAPDFP